MSQANITVDDLDAWECRECLGSGRLDVLCKVTHQLGVDMLPFWEECEACDSVGYCGPDAEKYAASKAKPS